MIEVVLKGERYYVCGECHLIYSSKDLAMKCEEWCRKHMSCNSEITSQSIGYLKGVGRPEIQI